MVLQFILLLLGRFVAVILLSALGISFVLTYLFQIVIYPANKIQFSKKKFQRQFHQIWDTKLIPA